MKDNLPGCNAKSVSMFTLGVGDVKRSIAFYEALGWECSPDSDPEMCMFVLSSNITIGLVPYDFLAKDALLPVDRKTRYRGFTMAINGASAEEVDALYERAIAAGAVEQQRPKWKDWGGHDGYSGYFLDPDGYVWEAAYAPTLRIDNDNRLLPRTKAEVQAG
ncbi:MAG: VOC family protein [Treponema sp.]|nr:VOC family protein [Treponema sp.]